MQQLIAVVCVLLQNGHPGWQVWLWESAAAEPGHIPVHQPQTAGGGATARPGLPDQQQVGHLLEHHILSVTCVEGQITLNETDAIWTLPTVRNVDVMHCALYQQRFPSFYNKTDCKHFCWALLFVDISQISVAGHLDHTSGDPLASRELVGLHWQMQKAYGEWLATLPLWSDGFMCI